MNRCPFAFLCSAQFQCVIQRAPQSPNDRKLAIRLFTLYEERAGDIVALIQYGYSNTADDIDHTDDLRLLVTLYAACVVEDLA